MDETLVFFPRQTLCGPASGGVSAVYYSEIFEVTEYSEITFELRVYENTVGAADVTAILLETSDPTFTDDPGGLAWEALQTITKDKGVAIGRAANPLRFVRMKVALPPIANTQVTLMIEGVARSGVS